MGVSIEQWRMAIGSCNNSFKSSKPKNIVKSKPVLYFLSLIPLLSIYIYVLNAAISPVFSFSSSATTPGTWQILHQPYNPSSCWSSRPPSPLSIPPWPSISCFREWQCTPWSRAWLGTPWSIAWQCTPWSRTAFIPWQQPPAPSSTLW